MSPRAGLDGFGKEKISSAYQDSNSGTIQPVASCYTKYANLFLLHEGLHKFMLWAFTMETVFSMRYKLRPTDVNVSSFISQIEDVGYIGLYKINKVNAVSSHS